jgi:hypothetical protein
MQEILLVTNILIRIPAASADFSSGVKLFKASVRNSPVQFAILTFTSGNWKGRPTTFFTYVNLFLGVGD